MVEAHTRYPCIAKDFPGVGYLYKPEVCYVPFFVDLDMAMIVSRILDLFSNIHV